MDRQALGKMGEDATAEYLRKHGCFIVARNYHAAQGYHEELDVIACDGTYLMFVEVKTRRIKSPNQKPDFAPEFAITSVKKKRLVLCAQQFLLHHSSYTCYQPRFDVACVLVCEKEVVKLEYYSNAFWADEVQGF